MSPPFGLWEAKLLAKELDCQRRVGSVSQLVYIVEPILKDTSVIKDNICSPSYIEACTLKLRTPLSPEVLPAYPPFTSNNLQTHRPHI